MHSLIIGPLRTAALANPPNIFLLFPAFDWGPLSLVRMPMQWVLSADGLVSNHEVTRRAGRASFCRGKFRAGIGSLLIVFKSRSYFIFILNS